MRAARDRNRLVKASMNSDMAGNNRAGVVTVISMTVFLFGGPAGPVRLS